MLRTLEITSLPVIVNTFIGEREASILLDEFKTQLSLTIDTQKIMFELYCMPPMLQIWIHGQTRDKNILMQGHMKCMMFAQMIFSDKEEPKTIFERKDNKQAFNILTQKENWEQLVQRIRAQSGAQIKKGEDEIYISKGKVWQNWLAQFSLLKEISEAKLGSEIFVILSPISISST